MLSGIFTSDPAHTLKYSAKVPMIGLFSLQKRGWPWMQYLHAPHQYPPPIPPRPRITRSPTCANSSAPGPSASTMPMAS